MQELFQAMYVPSVLLHVLVSKMFNQPGRILLCQATQPMFDVMALEEEHVSPHDVIKTTDFPRHIMIILDLFLVVSELMTNHALSITLLL